MFSLHAHELTHTFSQGLNVGDLLERALALKKAAREKRFESFNASSDNFLFLMQETGVKDRGRYIQRWMKHGQLIRYDGVSKYQLRGIHTHKPFRTPDLLGHVGISLRCHATTRELLGLLSTHRQDMLTFLKKHRIVALGADSFHHYGATVLSFKRGNIMLFEVFDRGDVVWRPDDVFLVRCTDPS